MGKYEIIDQVLKFMSEQPPPNVIAVFTLNPEDLENITVSIQESLPVHFDSSVQVHCIGNSESTLKGLHRGGTRTYRVVYDPNVFVYITPEQFINSHYRWLWKEVYRLYQSEPLIQSFFSQDDAFQECYICLEKILSKLTPEGYENLEVFVANRLRRHYSRIVERQLKLRRDDLMSQVRQLT